MSGPPFHLAPKIYSYVGLYIFVVVIFGFTVWLLGQGKPPAPPKHRTGMARSFHRQALRIAGSGSNLPLTHKLIQSFLQHTKQPATAIQLFPSIGSSGGIQALRDGVIDLALLSRPLRSVEKHADLRLLPYARVAVVVATHPSVSLREMTYDLLLKIYQGTLTQWTPNLPVVVLQRERGDSSHHAMYRVFPDFATINEKAYQHQRWQVIYRDQHIQESLSQIPGAVGIFDLGAIVSQKLPISIMSWHGISPTPDNVRTGRYPLYKDLTFLRRSTSCPRCDAFLDFVYSPLGQTIITANGYLPLASPKRGSL